MITIERIKIHQYYYSYTTPITNGRFLAFFTWDRFTHNYNDRYISVMTCESFSNFGRTSKQFKLFVKYPRSKHPKGLQGCVRILELTFGQCLSKERTTKEPNWKFGLAQIFSEIQERGFTWIAGKWWVRRGYRNKYWSYMLIGPRASIAMGTKMCD